MAEVDNYDDENFQDGFDEAAAAEAVNLNLWKRLFGFILPYRGQLTALGISAAVTGVLEAVYPAMVAKWIVDDVTENGADADFMLWGMVALGCNVLLALSVAAFVWVAGQIRVSASHDLRREAFANLQRLSFSFYDYRPVGWLMARMTADCERLTNILAWGFLDFIWGGTMMLSIAVVMFWLNWQLALVVLAVVPAVAWVSAKFRRSILTSARLVRATNSRITGSYNEGIMGVLTSKAFVREDANRAEFGDLTRTMYGASVRNMVLAAIFLPVVLIFSAVSVNLTLAVGGWQMSLGLVGAGTLIVFMVWARHFFDPVEMMGYWFAEMQMAQASAERVLSLIDAQPEIEDSESVKRAIAAQRAADQSGAPPRARIAHDGGAQAIRRIELRNVAFHYDARRPVLRDVSLAVESGETIAIVGPTGGGKSTLVNLICRFYEPVSGQVLVDGVDYRTRSLHWLQSNLGIVLQNAHVFSGSIMENIRYGRLDAIDEEVKAAAVLAGAHDFIAAMEDGYDTEVGEGGSRLSAGQRQLVSFARAILADPQILVMDEATSSVDTETEQRIQKGLANVLSGRISFVIAHRLSTIRNATRIAVIDGGELVELGAHEELMAAQGHYAQLYRQQSLNETTQDWGTTDMQPEGA